MTETMIMNFCIIFLGTNFVDPVNCLSWCQLRERHEKILCLLTLTRTRTSWILRNIWHKILKYYGINRAFLINFHKKFIRSNLYNGHKILLLSSLTLWYIIQKTISCQQRFNYVEKIDLYAIFLKDFIASSFLFLFSLSLAKLFKFCACCWIFNKKF